MHVAYFQTVRHKQNNNHQAVLIQILIQRTMMPILMEFQTIMFKFLFWSMGNCLHDASLQCRHKDDGIPFFIQFHAIIEINNTWIFIRKQYSRDIECVLFNSNSNYNIHVNLIQLRILETIDIKIILLQETMEQK